MELKTFNNYKKRFIIKAHRFNKSSSYMDYWLSVAEKQWNMGVPIILNVGDLSWQSGIDQEYIYNVSNKNRKNFYNKFCIEKRNHKNRTIYAPLPTLKFLQQWISENILSKVKIDPCAKAYRKGYNLKDNAKFHRKQDIVLKIDVEDFFSNLKAVSVLKFFKSVGYTKELSIVLTNLVTLDGFLPQGAPTSPIISNILMRDFDNNIFEICNSNSIRYTRYADDLTFSGMDFSIKKIFSQVTYQLFRQGLKVNKSKTRVFKSGYRQEVTGLVVNNAKVVVPRKYRRNLRLEVYYFCSNKQNFHMYNLLGRKALKDDKILYCSRLIGKVNFVLQYDKDNVEFREYKRKLFTCLKDLEN